MEKTFYDIHCHVLNPGHPSLVAFARRLNLDSLLALNTFFGPMVSIFTKMKMKRAMNMLSVMERDPNEFLLLMEEDLASLAGPDGPLLFGGTAWDSVVLTPLMMDFGRKGAESHPDIHYPLPPHRPIADQCVDLFNGIARFTKESATKKIEVYPFLGLNTRNYDMEGRDGHTGLAELLARHFGGFSAGEGEGRRLKLREHTGTFDGAIDRLPGPSFAGVKVYPPLGFDPWPDDPAEREKVRFLYDLCARARIPITTHCGGRGFRTLDRRAPAVMLSPSRWKPVLAAYPSLVLNMAHFGGKLRTVFVHGWMKEIAALALEYENVYTDISCLCYEESQYRDLERVMKKLSGKKSGGMERLAAKVLFGSDFMINLLWCESYRACLETFMRTARLAAFRDAFCSTNPARFLWG